MSQLTKYRLNTKKDWRDIRLHIEKNPTYEGLLVNYPESQERVNQLRDALDLVYEEGYVSPLRLQFKLHIGESTSLMLIDFMQELGIVDKQGEEPVWGGY